MINNELIDYKVRMSRRARRMRISVGFESGVVVTLPFGVKESAAKEFVNQKQSWIINSLNYLKRFTGRTVFKSGKREYLKYKNQRLH